MNLQHKLKLDWCTHEAAKYACEHWHYSRCMPSPFSKPFKIGVWEGGKFIGVVIFTTGVSSALGKPYGLKNIEACELQRVALARHVVTVTRVISIAICFLRKANPRLRLIVSFADPHEGHTGGIYQGGNWIFSGKTSASSAYFDAKGIEYHARNISKTGGYDKHGVKQYRRSSMARIEIRQGKLRYLMPLDDEMRKQIELLRKPYPKRAEGETKDTLANHAREGGSLPTSALHTSSEVLNG